MGSRSRSIDWIRGDGRLLGMAPADATVKGPANLPLLHFRFVHGPASLDPGDFLNPHDRRLHRRLVVLRLTRNVDRSQTPRRHPRRSLHIIPDLRRGKHGALLCRPHQRDGEARCARIRALARSKSLVPARCKVLLRLRCGAQTDEAGTSAKGRSSIFRRQLGESERHWFAVGKHAGIVVQLRERHQMVQRCSN